jgi:ribonuclease-3
LTAYRSSLVNSTTLAHVANKLGINDYLLLSHGESKDTGRARTYILANTFEALLGALYLDQGYDSAEKFIAKIIFPLIDEIVAEGSWVDSKSKFQEIAQEKVGVTPSYKTIKEVGPDHDKHFTVGVYLNNELLQLEKGDQNKKQSKMRLAKRSCRKKVAVK